MEIHDIVAAQRGFFNSGATRPYEFRREMLDKLQKAIIKFRPEICDALKTDLNKPELEAYMTETGIVLGEISYHLKHLKGWMKNRRVSVPISQFPSHGIIAPEPFGVALIMSPWNYPLQLCLDPLVGAISAGCCAVIKPSAYAPATSAVVKKLLETTFPGKYIAVIEGGREENRALLEEQFDYIFFTGSVAVGKTVMAAASKNLTPVTLELGGKSPVIVDENADIKVAARRIAFGKVINAGQTCVEPDYLFIHNSVKDKFIEEFGNAIKEFFPDGDMTNMPVIVNEKHYNRVTRLLKGEKAVVGGSTDPERRFVEPTLLVDITPESPVMQEEIFGPILPVMTYCDLNECIDFINSRPRPLAFYLFTESKAVENRVLNSCSFGGGCINDTIIHLCGENLPFGGVGASGMGSYHGKKSFDTFTHYRSVLKKANWLDLPMRYHPYTDKKLNAIKKFLK